MITKNSLLEIDDRITPVSAVHGVLELSRLRANRSGLLAADSVVAYEGTGLSCSVRGTGGVISDGFAPSTAVRQHRPAISTGISTWSPPV